MFWKRPPVRLLRLLSVAVLVVTAIVWTVPEAPTPWAAAVASRRVALGEGSESGRPPSERVSEGIPMH